MKNDLDRIDGRCDWVPDRVPLPLDLLGVFQYHSSFYAPWKGKIRQWFTPIPSIKETHWTKFLGQWKPIAAIHLRRGDYGKGMFYIPPNQWYLDWLETFWRRSGDFTLYIATDDPDTAGIDDFEDYAPTLARDIPGVLAGAEFFIDFYVMTQARKLAISNSSFSFFASMLNTHRRQGLFAPPDRRLKRREMTSASDDPPPWLLPEQRTTASP